MATDHVLQLKAYLDTSQVKAQISQLNSQGNVNLDASGITNSLNRLNDVIGKFTNSLDKLQQNTTKQAQQAQVNYGRLAQFAAGMATHQLAGAASRYLTAIGQGGVASTIGSVGAIGSNVAMGAAAGGPIGAIAGLGVGVLSESFNYCAKAAQDAADAIKSWSEKIQSAIQKDEQYEDIAEKRRLKALIETGSNRDIQFEAAKYGNLVQTQEEKIGAFLGKYGSIQNAMMSPEEKVAMRSSLKMQGLSSDEIEKRIRLEEGSRTFEIQAYENAQKLLQKYESQLEQLNKALDDRIKSEKDAADKEAKNAEAAEKERQSKEEQAKKLAEANAKHLDALRKSDIALEEGESVNEILKQSDAGSISETLSKYKSLTEQAYAKYQEDLASGDSEKATSSRAEWIRLRGYQKSLEGGLESIGETDLQNRFSDVQKLFSNLINPQTLSNLGAIGLSFGENMGQEDQLEKLQKIIDKLQELVDQGKDKQLANFTLG